MNKTLLSLGHGYSARALARLLIPQGWTVIGTTRSADKARTGPEASEMLIWPGTDLTPYIAKASHILASAGPGEAGDPFLPEITEALQTARPDWVGYLSTTGVYGDHGGDWVDETTPLTPSTQRGKARVLAEAQWQALGLPLHIFRLAGIYGPGRGPFAKVRAGRAHSVIKPGQVFSRIHVEDIAQTLAASIARPNPGTAYNLCDNEAAPPQDVIAHAAELLGLPRPPQIAIEKARMSEMARSFYAENKRVRNDRIKTDLGVTLKHPTYREGLKALLEAETQAPDPS